MSKDERPQDTKRCPDNGVCHHFCETGCFRVEYCGPLSGVYEGNQWPQNVIDASKTPKGWEGPVLAPTGDLRAYDEAQKHYGPNALPKGARYTLPTMRVRVQNEKINDRIIAEMYFDRNIRETFRDLPDDGIEFLKTNYLLDVMRNPVAIGELREWFEAKRAKGTTHQHEAWQIREGENGPYCAACGDAVDG